MGEPAKEKPVFAPDEIENLIRTHPQAWDVWLNGYQTGLTRGAAEAGQTQAQQAEASARRFYAMTADEQDTRRLAQIARDAIETAQARQKTDAKVAAMQAAHEKGRNAA